ncbi:MAG: hypothetical protein E7Z89_05390 [Cyanobacteria bacterium SIG28]|nr:hypothetical protein [Cyanobacteria bacterium SIG28]
MSDENRIETRKETCECFCRSEWFKKFVTKTLAVFVGVFSALSLFAALNKPPVPPCPCAYKMMRPPMAYHHHFNKFDKGPRGDFHKKMEKRKFDRFETKDFEGKPTVRVNVENKD